MSSSVLLIYAATLLVAVVVSTHLRRSILSMAVLFLFVGFLVEEEVLGLIVVEADDPIISELAKLTLFAVLYTDGMRAGLRELTEAWRLPGRALILGMPLVAVGTAALAHWITGFGWTPSFLLGAALAPTDPVFASAIVGREHVPQKLRRLLQVESGLNDGLALPFVVALLAIAGAEQPHYGKLAGEVAAGVAVGVTVAYTALKIEQTRLFGVAPQRQPLAAFAIGLLVLAIARASREWGFPINEFLAAFSAGVTVASVAPETRDAFHEFGEFIADVFKFATLLLLGALISPAFLATVSTAGWLFVLTALFLMRPLALNLALLRSCLPWRERIAASWFGPKGFASVVYAILILQGGLSQSDELFHLAAVVIAFSIIAHASTDVIVAGWFPEKQPEGRQTDTLASD